LKRNDVVFDLRFVPLFFIMLVVSMASVLVTLLIWSLGGWLAILVTVVLAILAAAIGFWWG
jgi:type IV secretory pathway TrbL component